MIVKKSIKKRELCESENHKLTAKTSFITKRFNLEYKQRCYKVKPPFFKILKPSFLGLQALFPRNETLIQ